MGQNTMHALWSKAQQDEFKRARKKELEAKRRKSASIAMPRAKTQPNSEQCPHCNLMVRDLKQHLNTSHKGERKAAKREILERRKQVKENANKNSIASNTNQCAPRGVMTICEICGCPVRMDHLRRHLLKAHHPNKCETVPPIHAKKKPLPKGVNVPIKSTSPAMPRKSDDDPMRFIRNPYASE